MLFLKCFTNDLSYPAIRIFPNPTRNILKIESLENIDRIRIYDTFGQLYDLAKEQNTLDISELRCGIYIIEMQSNNKTVIRKILKI